MTPDNAQTVSVALGERSYDIHVGPDLLARAGDLVGEALARPFTVIITDENVAPLHLGTLTTSLDKAGIDTRHSILPAGEKTKNFKQLEDVLEALLDHRVERRDTIIALGGGVIGDLTGFAAAILRRGIKFIQIPTTLLAQVDSSVGGKTGINTAHGKNLIGAFHQPRLVLADTGVLDSLPRRELHAGYAEVVKYGLIRDAGFYDWLQTNGGRVLAGDTAARIQAITTSCQAKADVVAADERESGERALLNLGHTFGHALEAETGYGERLLHGEGVAIGMVLALDLSARMGLCGDNAPASLRAHFASLGMPASLADIPGPPLDPGHLVAHMMQDKKVSDGKITFVLARGIGDAFLTNEVDLTLVEQVLTNSAHTNSGTRS